MKQCYNVKYTYNIDTELKLNEDKLIRRIDIIVIKIEFKNLAIKFSFWSDNSNLKKKNEKKLLLYIFQFYKGFLFILIEKQGTFFLDYSFNKLFHIKFTTLLFIIAIF